MFDIKEELSKTPFWRFLSDDEKETMARGSEIREFKKSSLAYNPREECLGLTLLLSGELRAFILSESGREITLYRIHEGDICTLSAYCVVNEITFETQYFAQTDCSLLIVAPFVLKRLMEKNLNLRCFFFEYTAKRFSEVMVTMQDILFKGFDRRLATFLINEFERTGSKKIRLTHEQIAQYTSSAREVVARTAKRLSDDGLIASERGTVKILDVEGLKELL